MLSALALNKAELACFNSAVTWLSSSCVFFSCCSTSGSGIYLISTMVFTGVGGVGGGVGTCTCTGVADARDGAGAGAGNGGGRKGNGSRGRVVASLN